MGVKKPNIIDPDCLTSTTTNTNPFLAFIFGVKVEACGGGISIDGKTIKDAVLERTPSGSKGTKVYSKSGGLSQAESDFYALKPKNVKVYDDGAGGKVTVGELSDGTKVNFRSKTTDELARPTLEIQTPNRIKIRYD